VGPGPGPGAARAKGLDNRRVTANVLLVAPAEELAARALLALESRKLMTELDATCVGTLLQVNHAKASELAKLFQSVTRAGGGDR
jgi:type IV pilus assembly protein PilQ